MPDKKATTALLSILGTTIALGILALVTASLTAYGKASDAVQDVIVHDGAVEAHPVIQKEIESNYEMIQQQLGSLDEKIDRVLEAVDGG